MTQEVTRIVWTSRLTPISNLHVRILHQGAEDLQHVFVRFSDATVSKDLTSRYGPRPTTG